MLTTTDTCEGCAASCRAHGRPGPAPCDDCSDVGYRLLCLVAADGEYERIADAAKERQRRQRAGRSTAADKHAGEVAAQIARLIRASRETARALLPVALLVYGRGPLAEGVRPDALPHAQESAFEAIDAYRRRELGAPACKNRVEVERCAYLTTEAAQALAAAENRRAESKAKRDRSLDLNAAMRVLTTVDADTIAALDDVAADAFHATAVSVIDRLTALVTAQPATNIHRAAHAATCRVTLAEYERDTVTSAASPTSGGSEASSSPTRELLKARLGLAPRSVLRLPSDEDAWRRLVRDSGETRQHAIAHPTETGTVSVPSPTLAAFLIAAHTNPGDLILDPFTGGPTRPVIAAHLGRRYEGLEIRPDQAEATRRRIQELPGLASRASVHLADASTFAWSEHIDAPAAASISCPPYFNLERYSDDPRDLSAARSYDEFLELMGLVIDRLTPALGPGAMVAWILGEMRDRGSGRTHFLPDDARRLFCARGFEPHDGTIVLERSQPSTGAGNFTRSKRVLRVHEEIVVMRAPA